VLRNIRFPALKGWAKGWARAGLRAGLSPINIEIRYIEIIKIESYANVSAIC